MKSAGKGVVAGLLLVIAIVIIGAMLGYKGREGGKPEPTPSVDHSTIIAPQGTGR